MKAEDRNNVEIILVEPAEPGNIGSAARAMHNMGFSRMGLVNPVEYKVSDTYRLAWNSREIIDTARVYPSLREAVADKSYVVAMSTRMGKDRGYIEILNEFVPEIAKMASKASIAILFGRESWGLTNEELQFANRIVRIHTAGEYSSLNLAQAVLVTCYQMLCCEGVVPDERPAPAPHEEVERCFEHIEKVLKKVGYGSIKGDPCIIETIMHTVRKMAGRLSMEPVEVRMLRGVCSQTEVAVDGFKDLPKKPDPLPSAEADVISPS